MNNLQLKGRCLISCSLRVESVDGPLLSMAKVTYLTKVSTIANRSFPAE